MSQTIFSLLNLGKNTGIDDLLLSAGLDVEFEPADRNDESSISIIYKNQKAIKWPLHDFYNFSTLCRTYLGPKTSELLIETFDQFDSKENPVIIFDYFKVYLWDLLPLYITLNSDRAKYSLSSNKVIYRDSVTGNVLKLQNSIITLFCQNLKSFIVYPLLLNFLRKLSSLNLDIVEMSHLSDFLSNSLVTSNLDIVGYVEVDAAKYLIDQETGTSTLFCLPEQGDELVVLPGVKVFSAESFSEMSSAVVASHSVYKVLIDIKDILSCPEKRFIKTQKFRVLEESFYHKAQILSYTRGKQSIKDFNSASALPKPTNVYLAPHPSLWSAQADDNNTK